MTDLSPEELVTAYVDDEFESAAQRREAEALLASSQRWRLRARVEAGLRDALAEGSGHRAPAELRASVESAIAQPARNAPSIWIPIAVAVGLVLAAVLVVRGQVDEASVVAEADPIPMVEAVVDDYAVRTSESLPELGDVESEPTWSATTSLRRAGARVVSSWTVRIRGEEAVAYAFVWKQRIVVQYVVSSALFLRQPAVRDAVVSTGSYSTQARGHAVAGWLDSDRGTLLVGRLDPDELLEVRQS